MDGIWQVLESKLEYGALVPTPVSGIVRADLRKRDGSPYTILKNPHGDKGAGTYVRLEPADVQLFELMDGKRSTSEILVAHLQSSGYLALDRLGQLTAALAANGFFGEARVDAYARLRQRRALRDPLVSLSILLRRLVMWNIASWSNAEGTVDLLYRLGGRVFFTSVGGAAVVIWAVGGLALWAIEFASPRHDLFTLDGSVVQGILVLILLQVLAISIHEAGHALAIRHFGRRVRRLGLAIYYLFPCMYVDATDMVLAPRWQRVIVAVAGPLAGVTVATACMAVVVTTESAIAASVAMKAATLLVFQFVFNLLPILDLDGYHILSDALDAPLLRQRALAFVRAAAIRKVQRRERWKPGEIGLALYGASAVVASLGMLGLGVWIWQQRAAGLAHELLGQGLIGPLILALFLLVFVGPLVVAVAIRVLGLGRVVIRPLEHRRKQQERAQLQEKVAILARVRFLSSLNRAGLVAIASHLVEEQVGAGDIVVTYGEPGDKFYLVRSGGLEVLDADGSRRGAIIPGEGFGELALLDGTTRSATVRGTRPTVLWSLDRSHFARWIRDRYEVAARIRASDEERARFARMPFFSSLGPAEMARIAPKLVTTRVPAGQAVFRAGDRGDRYYIVREGTVEISGLDGTIYRTLGPDDGFGELALLFGTPRTATATARSDVLLASLARSDFAGLVRASGETLGQFSSRTAEYVNAPGIGSTIAAKA